MLYLLNYDAHGADRKDFDLIEEAIREVGRNTDDVLESAWELTSSEQSAADLITKVAAHLRRRRSQEGLGGLTVTFHAAQIVQSNRRRRNVGV